LKFISTTQAPKPGGHYSQGVKAAGLIFVSGMLPQGNNQPPMGFEAQVHSALDHCSAVLAAADCSFSDVVQCTVYIVGVENWPAFNQVYAERFGEHRPARAVVPVPALHHGFLVEVQMVAEAGLKAHQADQRSLDAKA
jgi:reactive intermediate/imine deaminase